MRASRDGLAAGVALVVVAAVGVGAASAGAAPDEARLDWRNWSLFGDSRDRLGVRYVWDAQYDGIQFPVRPTTVLEDRGPATRALLARVDARPLHGRSLDREPLPGRHLATDATAAR